MTKRILALSLNPLGAGWAFGSAGYDKPMSGLLTFGGATSTDDEVWRNAAKEVLDRIKFHDAKVVAMTAVPDLTASAQRLYDLQIAVRLVVKWALPGAAMLVDIGNALECFAGTGQYPTRHAADAAAMQEARRRLWLGLDKQHADRALALTIWAYAAAPDAPELAFGKARAA